MPEVPDIIVERNDSRGGRFAVRVPFEIKGDRIVIDHQTAFGAFELLRSEANSVHGEPVVRADKPARGPRHRRKRKL